MNLAQARSRGWHWSPALLALLSRLGIPWEVRDDLSREDLGTSPDDACWTGDRFLFERGADVAHLWHDVGHWLVCRRDTPDLLACKNFGYEDHPGAAHEEGDAADVGLALQMRARVPWRGAAMAMSYDMTGHWPPLARFGLDASEYGWAHCRRSVLASAAPYLEAL